MHRQHGETDEAVDIRRMRKDVVGVVRSARGLLSGAVPPAAAEELFDIQSLDPRAAMCWLWVHTVTGDPCAQILRQITVMAATSHTIAAVREPKRGHLPYSARCEPARGNKTDSVIMVKVRHGILS
jgi:hypothetical protein